MNPLYDYKKYAILYVDDEEKSLKYFAEALNDTFRIFTASSAKKGYEILLNHKDDIAILITDQRMPDEVGTKLLKKTRHLCPQILRILVTAYSDMDAAIAAINTGSIYKYITKPWMVPDLQMTLMRGIEFFILQKQRDQLVTEKLSSLHKLMIADRIISLSLLATGMRHHVNNSLVAIKTFLKLTPKKLKEERVNLDHLNNPDFWLDFYNQAQGSLDSITELLSDLLVVSNRTVFEYNDSLQLHKVLEEILAGLQDDIKPKSIQIDCKISEQFPLLTADKAKFYRIFELLLKDEILNLPEGCHIEITARFDKEKDSVIIKIRDNGPGFADEIFRSAFDPFFVRNKDNSQEFGLYLMASYFLVYHHGGKIDINSHEVNGTIFTIELPLHPPSSSQFEIDRQFFRDTLLNQSLWEKVLVEN